MATNSVAIHELPLLCFVIPEGLIGDPYSLFPFWIPACLAARLTAKPRARPLAFAGMTQKQEIPLIPTFTGGEFPLD